MRCSMQPVHAVCILYSFPGIETIACVVQSASQTHLQRLRAPGCVFARTDLWFLPPMLFTVLCCCHCVAVAVSSGVVAAPRLVAAAGLGQLQSTRSFGLLLRSGCLLIVLYS